MPTRYRFVREPAKTLVAHNLETWERVREVLQTTSRADLIAAAMGHESGVQAEKHLPPERQAEDFHRLLCKKRVDR